MGNTLTTNTAETKDWSADSCHHYVSNNTKEHDDWLHEILEADIIDADDKNDNNDSFIFCGEDVEEDDDDDDDDDWFLLKSAAGNRSLENMSSHAFPLETNINSDFEPEVFNSAHTKTSGDKTSAVVTESDNHGILALREAAQQQQQQQQQHMGCLPFGWWLSTKKASNLWLDLSSSFVEEEKEEDGRGAAGTVAEEKEDIAENNVRTSRTNQDTDCTCRPGNQDNDKKSTQKKIPENSQSGMLLWTSGKEGHRSSSWSLPRVNCSVKATTQSSTTTASGLSSPTSSTSLSTSSSSSWFASSSSFLSMNDLLEYTNAELELSAVEPTPESDLSQPRHVWIVTTAALPWMTGTAVNPLLRAASLWQRYQDKVEASAVAQREEGLGATMNMEKEEEEKHDGAQHVSSSCNRTMDNFSITLVLPWLCREQDRMTLYGDEWKSKTVQDQEFYIRSWLSDRAKLPRAAQSIAIQWYTAHYHPPLSSIFAVDDVCDACLDVPANRMDAVVVLEEPEHLNCYRAPGKATWGQRFGHVIGIVHTNYRAYAQSHASGLVMGPLVGAIFASLVRAYCDKVIKLSDVLQSYSPEKQVTCNVHGIRQEFLQVPAPTGNKVYFIGKLLWAKGLDKMLVLQSRYKKATGKYFPLDIYGSGPQEEEIRQAFLGKLPRQSQQRQSQGEEDQEDSVRALSLSSSSSSPRMPVEFMGRVDHAALSPNYKIFVNPSITEVLCTTTAEALAMGKFVLIPHHASNHFFSQFPNCLQYKPGRHYEFCVLLHYALTHAPTPLSAEQAHLLTWEAATDRFIKASSVSLRDAARRERIRLATRRRGRQGNGSVSDEGEEDRFVQFHEEVCKGTSGKFVRTILHGNDPLNTSSNKETTGATVSTTQGVVPIHSPEEEEKDEEEADDESGSSTSGSSQCLGEFDDEDCLEGSAIKGKPCPTTLTTSSSFSWIPRAFS